jgi:phosphohistidine phosphatase
VEIYLVRHAEALERREGLEDSLRHLTLKGRRQAAKQARRLKKNKVRPELIMTSPIVRAVQTSELLALQVGKGSVIAAHSSLAYDAEAEGVLKMIREAGKLKSLMLVGHEPQLSRVAAFLLGFEHIAPLQKGSCLALSWKPEKEGSHAVFQWYAAAGKKLVTSARKALVR